MLHDRISCYLPAPVCTPHHTTTWSDDSLWGSNRDREEKNARLCTTLFSTTNLLPTYGLDIVILSFIPALVELLGKILSLVLMKATFVKYVPSTLHPQWIRRPSMHTNFCLRITLAWPARHKPLTLWVKRKWKVCVWLFVRAGHTGHNKANPIWDNLMHILCWLNWHLLYNVTVQDLIQQQTTLYSNLIGNSLLSTSTTTTQFHSRPRKAKVETSGKCLIKFIKVV